MDCFPITECLACGSPDLKIVLDLNCQPLANAYKKSPVEIQQEFPLAINRCEHCSHVQLTHQVNPELMFKNYAYVSGTTKTQLEYFDWLVEFITKEFGSTPKTILDIGCNDGSFLNAWGGTGAHTFGVDPAENLHKLSSVHHTVHCGFFTGKEFGDKKFDVITCLNAFAHNSNPLVLLRNIRERMYRGSKLICTTSQADMILNGEFDTIYHEHVSYFNIQSAATLCKRAGLTLTDVQRHPIHGGSFIFVIEKDPVLSGKHEAHINDLIQKERDKEIYDSNTYYKFAEDAFRIMNNFAEFVRACRKDGLTIVGYGAPAKGNTLLNFANEKPDFIVEDNPLKQNLYTPGMSCPIYPVEYLNLYEESPLVIIPLAWNFYDEIYKKVKLIRHSKETTYMVRYFPYIRVDLL